MKKNTIKISVIIPVLNEQDSIGLVIRDIPKDLPDEIIVVDNGSTDNTITVAQEAGARVVKEEVRGYGAACLKGIASADNPDVIVFLDGDYSDYPDEMNKIITPILKGEADLVLGSRIAHHNGRKALLPQAYWGNRLTTWLINIIYHYHYTDLGPFRAIRAHQLQMLDMRDKNYGWTVEMQIKAIKNGLTIAEIPVNYRKRIGKSKVTGTLSGTIKAGVKILYRVFFT